MYPGYYVYHHYDSLGNLRYIGAGSGYRLKKRNRRNDYWKSVFANERPIAKVVCYNLSKEDALKIEALHIFLARLRGDKITNLMSGGGKPPNFLGKKRSEEFKKKISLAKMGSIPPNKGKPMSQEQKNKISKSMKGKSYSESHKQNMSKSLKTRIMLNIGIPGW